MAKDVLVISQNEEINSFLTRVLYNLGLEVFSVDIYEEIDGYADKRWKALDLIIVDAPEDPEKLFQFIEDKNKQAQSHHVPILALISMPYLPKAKSQEELEERKVELEEKQVHYEETLPFEAVHLKRSFKVDAFISDVKDLIAKKW